MTRTVQTISMRVIAIVITVTLLATLVCGCTNKQDNSASEGKNTAALDKITFATGGPLPALVMIAADQGYFVKEGLELTIKPFVVGKLAIDDMLTGASDIANSAETPIVQQSLGNDELLIISSLRSTDNLNRIAARKDRGVNSIPSLKGRKVGIASGIAPHYFFDLALAKYGMSEKDIVPVFMKTAEMQGALAAGSVDAIATISTVAHRTLEQLGEKGVVLEEPGICLNYSILTATKKYAAANPEKITRLLKALSAAEQFKKQHPDKSREIVMAAQKIAQKEYDSVWSGYDDRLLLDNSMLLTLEENTRWVMEKGFVAKGVIPNYLNRVNAGYLEKVSPASVRLKR